MTMAWYPHFMSDYESDTTHLSLMEHGAYRLLLDHYYKKQKPLPANASLLHRICRAFAADEQAAVQTVLDEFFVLENDGYHQRRADKEIDKAQEISAKRSAAAQVRHKGSNDLQAKSTSTNGTKDTNSTDASAVQMHSKSKVQKHANAVHVDTQLTTHNSQLIKEQDHNSEKKDKRADKPHDPRSKHPAIVAVQNVRGSYPPKDIWDSVIELLGEHPDVPRLKKCWLAWRTKGYKPTNYDWLIDWYPNGIQGESNGANQQRNGYTTATEKRERTLGNRYAIIEDLRGEGGGDYHEGDSGKRTAVR